MEEVKYIAAYICQRYRTEFGSDIDEMKLHKLLYFCQRESIVQTGEPMFSDCFEAWKYGPVLVSIRQLYRDGSFRTLDIPQSIEQFKSIFDKVFDMYAAKDSWSLSSLTHGEYSWQKAREGYAADDQCDVVIDVEDIRKDAERIKMRRLALSLMKKIKG